MKNMPKQDLVLLLIKKATDKKIDNPGIPGRKALQKSFYFLNQHDDFFTFKWNDHGPFSGELQQITKDLIHYKNVSVQEKETKKIDTITNHMTFAKNTNPYFTEDSIPEKIHSEIDKIIDFVIGKSPNELELLASVHYWANKKQFASENYPAKHIYDKLTELKPDAGFSMSDITNAIETLVKHHYLHPNKQEN